MEWVGPVIEIVKLVGGQFVRYLKYQIKYNDLLQKFEQSKQRLRSRKHEIESERDTQLQSATYHVVKAEVEDWLKEVGEFIGKEDVVDEVNSWGYLSCCCRAVILKERAQELKEICDSGDKYTRECLVIEDPSKKLNYDVEKFNELKEKLQCKQGDVDLTLQSQLGYWKIEKKEVKHWRGKVEETLKGVRDIEDKIRGPLAPSSSDSLVMRLGEKIREMERMCEEGSQLPDCLVIDDPSTPAVELPVPKLQGNEAVKAKILADLKGEKVAKLGVCGMGGIGKTTIMKHIHNELQKQPKFKKIIWVTVSQNCEIYNLQEQIASCLEEQLREETDTARRAGELFQMLKEDKHKPFLLILDDVWDSLDLNEVGIPELDVTNGCKLVLTTRSQEITRSMDCETIKVEVLPQQKALPLFLNQVGDAILSYPGGGIKKDLESTLKKIVDECDGLPLALITVAGSLKKIVEPRLWSVALNQLQDCKRNVAGTVDDAYKTLKFSYDRLKNPQIQNCFLYCALYPEDYNIPREEIIEYWIDEGFIYGMGTRQAMKDEGLNILMKLVDNSLLEPGENTESGECVRMHDVIRDMALDITRRSSAFLVEAGKALRELPEKCAEDVEKVSLMCNHIQEIPCSMASSTCTRLTTLLLAYNDLSTIPESVFEHMPKLKILDLSFNRELRSLPNSVSKLVKLTTLLLESTSLVKVPSLSGLGSLKKLNLRDTEIKQVPEGLGMLTNLKCLFLCGSNSDNILEIDEIADGVLSNLSKLEELIVDWSRIELKGDVVGRLKKLEVFHGWFPTVNDMRIFLQCQGNRLSSYSITVGSNSDSDEMIYGVIEGLPRYKKIMVFKEISIVGENTLLPSIQVLCIKACRDIRSLNDFSVIKDATNLRSCLIWNCDGMECVLSSWINNPVVQTLEYLKLDGLHKLDGLFEAKVIAESPPPPGTFSSLKKVVIWSCKKIKKLFPSWNLVEYPSLEEISVYDCEEMEEIIASDPEGGGEGGDIIKELIFPKLKELELRNLPALKSICSRRIVMVCDSLEDIVIVDCKGLRRISFHLPPLLFLYELDNLDWMFEGELIATSPPQPSNFSSLKEVKIWDCKRAKKLFPSWKLVEYLRSLEKICVEGCDKMEEIIASDSEEEGEGEGGDIIKKLILPKLNRLELGSLPALKNICSRRAVMVCDSLEEIKIGDCKGLRRIPFHLPPHVSLFQLDNLDWLFEVELIAMSPPQPITFSSLKKVTIRHCKRVKMFPSWKLVEYLQSLEEIKVYDCEEMEEIIASDPEEEGEGGDIIKKLILPKLKLLRLLHLPALKSICSRRAVMVCDSLESIDIRDCKGLRRIPFHLPPRVSLESIDIKDCKGLRRIPFHLPPRVVLMELDNFDWEFEVELIAMSPPQPSTFSSLKEVTIRHCKRVKMLFPSWKLVEYLQSLEEIKVYDCEEMEEIIASDPEEEGEGGDIIKKLILPKLNSLHLENLPALKSICSMRAVMVCDSLESIHINNCKALRRIPFRLPPYLYLYKLDNLDWVFEGELIAMSSPQPSSFSSLKKVTIWHCKRAKKLFPSWKLVEYLESLEEITVKDCKEMEEIIASDPEEEGEGGDIIIKKLILPKLEQLKLWELPALKSICSRRAVMVCDSLKEIDIFKCKGLRRIPFRLPPPVSLRGLDNLDWVFEGQLIATSPPQPGSFSSLNKVTFMDCKRAKKLFPSWKLVEYLQSLEEINVWGCEEMEEIIA